MKTLKFASVVVAACFVISGCCSAPVQSLKLAKHTVITLPNGLHVLSIEDHSLPYVGIGLLVKSGSADDPMSKSGLASLTASLLDRGTREHTATQLADQFALLGTSFSATPGADFMYFSSASLAKDQNQLLKLFFETITEPTFQTSEVNRRKKEVVAEIRRDYDQPSWVASRLFAQYLYGPHPYARASLGTLRDVQTIRKKDIIQFYLNAFRPNNCELVMVGDWQGDTQSELNKILANWKARQVAPAAMPPLIPINGQQILLVDRGDLKQTEIRIGHYGIKRNNKDYQALMLADVILSGGFNSRLMREIRVNKGLTYGISASFDALKDIGPFVITTDTRNEKAGEVVADTIQVLQKFHDKGVTAAEVKAAKGYLRGTFPQRLETDDDLASNLMALRFYGVDESYLTNYIRNLNSLSVGDINKVIKKYFHPANMRILVYGPKSIVLKELRPLGAVEVKPFKELETGL